MHKLNVSPAHNLRLAVLLFPFLFLNMTGHHVATRIAGGDDLPGAQQTIDRFTKALSELHHERNELEARVFEQRLTAMLREVFDVERFAPQLLQKRWRRLNLQEKQVFQEALLQSISKKLARVVLRSEEAVPSLMLQSSELRDNFAKMVYSYTGRNEQKQLTLFMLKYGDGRWKVSNIKDERQTLLRYYYELCDDLLDDYSFAYLVAELRDDGYVVLEDFESSEIGALPRNWTWKSKDDKKNKPYRVEVEDGNRYLAARDNGESVILGKDVKWNLNKYPYVSFRWRAHALPEGGDERYGRSVDSAAGIYFIYKKKMGLIPESVKYVWSTTLPVGSAMRRSGTGRPWMVVAESGDAHLGEWRTYVFDLREAYKKTFGGNPPDRPIGIGLLSDANSTRSKAYADYDDIRALRHADADSGIKQFLDAE